MVKVNIKKKDGAHITIEGTEDEVKRLLNLIHNDKSTAKQSMRKQKNILPSKISIADMLHELKEEGFFDNPRSLVEIKNALAGKGRIYEMTTLSGPVIRQVRKRSLGRIKKEGKWMYVKR